MVALGRPQFTEDWFCQASCDTLARLARSVAHLSGTVVEVGCWEGKSTIALANAVWPLAVRAVDTWQGSPGEPSAVLAAERDVFDRFRNNVCAATRGNVWPYRMGWRDYFEQNRHPVKFLHIDAEHTYTEVRENIEAALPLVVPGGVICGDDAHHEPVRQAVIDTLGGDCAVEATLWIWRAP